MIFANGNRSCVHQLTRTPIKIIIYLQIMHFSPAPSPSHKPSVPMSINMEVTVLERVKEHTQYRTSFVCGTQLMTQPDAVRFILLFQICHQW